MVKEKSVKIDGSDEFPFDSLGLTKGSIRRKGDEILIPIELLPYLKLCILPLSQRIRFSDYMYKRRKNLRPAGRPDGRNNGGKSSKRGGAK